MAYTANSLKSRFLSRTYIFNPATATDVAKVAWVPMGVRGLFKATLVSGTGVLTFKVFAGLDASGTTPTEVATHAGPTVADAAGDQLVIEIDAAQVQAALAHATHVSVEIDCDHADDIVSIEYLIEPYRAADGLTADVIA